MAKNTKAAKSAALVGEVCLYGARHCGHGWLARSAKGTMKGDGEPVADLNMTAALWFALEELEAVVVAETGKAWGRVTVFAPGGTMMAECAIGERPYFGSLVWAPATVYVVAAPVCRCGTDRPCLVHPVPGPHARDHRTQPIEGGR